MSISSSVSQWIEGVKQGDSAAATHLWNRYHRNLLRLTRYRLHDSPRGTADEDEDDVVSRAFHSFLRRARAGQFPDLRRRAQLWALLVTIADRKVVNCLRRVMAHKRGFGRVRGESAWAGYHGGDSDGILMLAKSLEPSPEMSATVTELFESLDDQWRQIILLKQDGYTHEQIAQRVNRSVATVERKLRLLRHQWEQELLQ